MQRSTTLRGVHRDVEEIEGALGRLEEHVREARAAAEVLRDGDSAALGELDGTVDAMAQEIAALKSRTAGTGLQ